MVSKSCEGKILMQSKVRLKNVEENLGIKALKFSIYVLIVYWGSGRSGGILWHAPPSNQIFLDFMQFSGNVNPIVSRHPPK